MQTIKKSIGEGVGKGDLYAALAYRASDGFGGLAIKQVRFNPTSGATAIIIGDSTTAITLSATTVRAISIATTNALTSGTVRSVQIDQIHTGIGAIAEALTSIVTTNVALGSWANAIFGKLDFQTAGKVTGLGGVICAELTMAGGAVSQGTYCAYQAEINLPASYSSGVPISVMRINTWGDQKADFDTYGYLFDIQGIAVGASKFFQTNVTSTMTHSLRLRIGSTVYYIGLHSTANAS